MKRFAQIFSMLAAALLVSGRQSAADVLADYTLSNDTTGYVNGLPQDSVGGHNFTNGFGSNVAGFGGNIGGPSSTSSQFDGNGGFYGTTAGTTTLPNNNVAVEVHAFVTTLSQGDLFSSFGNAAGDLQIAEDGSGHWTAFITNSGTNNSGDSLGTAAITLSSNTDLKVTDIANVFTLYVNGVAVGPGVTPSTAFEGFDAMHIAVAPGGGGPNFTGSLSDLTISTVPEPASFALLIVGAAGLFIAARRRK